MPEMPSLGDSSPKKSPLVPVALAAVIFSTVVGGGYWFTHRTGTTEPAAPVAAVVQVDAGTPVAELQADGGVAPVAATAATPAPENKTGLKTLAVTINGPLESAIVSSAGKEVGNALTQVVNRSLVWWLRVPQDLVKGDTLAVVYETREGQEPLVHAVRFTSRKLGKTLEAWRFQPKEGPFARFFQTDGSELEERLVDGPLDNWEQITSLLRDGRKHKGVDFKTPVGTPVKATFDGTITRRNWNFRGNGNSIEVQESGGAGRTAMFLHLSELPKTSAQPGQHVKKGEVLGKSGNTGHSFAPHLHYQLMKGETVLDPFTSHQTTRAQLPAADKAAFEAQVAKLKALMPAETVVGG
jgi:murein DD-endopeptidase MepM/ murein hydrolase activator NlpD